MSKSPVEPEEDASAATDYVEFDHDHSLVDGIGREARLGLLPTTPGEIRRLV